MKLVSMNFINSAAEVWTKLHDRFSGVNGHRVYQILRDMEPSVNCVCGAHKVQEEREQRRKLITQNHSTNNNRVTQSNMSGNHGNNFSGSGNHQRSMSSNANKQPMKYSYCNGDNHLRETCFKLHGYPPKRNKKKGKPPNTNYNFRTILKSYAN